MGWVCTPFGDFGTTPLAHDTERHGVAGVFLFVRTEGDVDLVVYVGQTESLPDLSSILACAADQADPKPRLQPAGTEPPIRGAAAVGWAVVASSRTFVSLGRSTTARSGRCPRRLRSTAVFVCRPIKIVNYFPRTVAALMAVALKLFRRPLTTSVTLTSVTSPT